MRKNFVGEICKNFPSEVLLVLKMETETKVMEIFNHCRDSLDFKMQEFHFNPNYITKKFHFICKYLKNI